MNDLTLESLARRVEALERALEMDKRSAPAKDWRSAIGMFSGDEFSRQVDEEGRKIREAEREEARRAEQAE